MDTSFSSLFRLYHLPTGRRLFAMAQAKEAATQASFSELAEHADVCIQHDRDLRTIEARWSGQLATEAQFAPEAREIDAVLDGVLTAIRDTAQRHVDASAPGDPFAVSGANLLKEMFPKDVAAVTALPYVEELAQVERILGVLQAPTWVPTVKELGLSRLVTRLEDLAKQYKAALDVPSKAYTYDQVKAARDKGHQLMLQAVAMIMGRHPSDSDADKAGRAALLTPILRQNEATRQALRVKRPVEDVDPGTGEPVPAPAEQAKPVAGPVEADKPSPASAAPV